MEDETDEFVVGIFKEQTVTQLVQLTAFVTQQK